MGALADKALELSPYLRCLPGEALQGIYMGFRTIPDQRNPLQEKFQYTIKINDKNKFWESGSTSIALELDKCKSGDKITILNEGVPEKAKYKVKQGWVLSDMKEDLKIEEDNSFPSKE
jgi:hypothetical protein